MNKNTTPIVIVALVVVLGGAALWYSMKNSAAPGDTTPVVTPAPTASSTGTPSVSGLPDAPPNLPPGTEVVGKTVWQGISGDDWKLVFQAQTVWKINTIKTEDGKHLSQVTGGDDTTTYFVSRDLKISEPSGLSYTTKSLSVAGRTVTAHVYTNPNTTNAFYMYFSIPVEGDTYYFRLASKVASMKVANDFISLIALR